ncbi:MAG: hypothetical protein AAFZ87_16225, partial [Planctomycetota bacterium]
FNGHGDRGHAPSSRILALLARGRTNDARVPLAPSLRQEIDYLIPLTYFEQGRATDVEEDRP